MVKGRAIDYSFAELAWIERHCTLVRKEAHRLFCEAFGRDDVSFKNYIGLCKRKGWMTGRTGQYAAGAVPANKGKKMPYHAKRAATQFKKGNVPCNAKYAGHERVTKDGYIEVSVNETNKHTGFKRRYVLKHRYLWEQKHGAVPEQHCLKCLDGNRQNCDPANWEVIPRGALPFLNGHRGHDYETAPAVLKPIIMTSAKLKYARSVKSKEVK